MPAPWPAQPKLLLLDEPLAALDKKLREHTQFELMTIQEQTGVTFVVVTHDQEEAMTLSDRIAVMDKGQVRQVGTATEVYEYPNSRFVAGFIGSINDLRRHRVFGSRAILRPSTCRPSGARFWPAPCLASRRAWRVTLALRPEKIAITRERAEGPNTISGVVEDLAYFGKDSLYRVALPSGQIVSVNSRQFAPGRMKRAGSPTGKTRSGCRSIRPPRSFLWLTA